jgi:thiol-disulfide isomerase/thioredoxin
MMSERQGLEPETGKDISFHEHGRTGLVHRLGQLFQIVAMLCVLGLFALVTLKYSPFNPDRVPVGVDHPGVGKQLEALSLMPLTGGADCVDRASLSGKVVLINFWGTWCPPCREEFPKLVATVEKFADEPRFRFLSVSCAPAGEDRDLDALRGSTEAFLAQHASNCVTYADPDLVTRKAVDRAIGFSGYPTTILMDESGVIRAVWEGYWRGLESEIEQAIRDVLARSRKPVTSSN